MLSIAVWFRDCIHAVFQMRWSTGAIVVALAVACGRTDLGLDPLSSSIVEMDAAEEPVQPKPDAPAVPPPSKDAGQPTPTCVPSEEVCNGRDDDCNGEIDEVSPIPCPGGGFRYCVAGSYSSCPVRCETCMPGSERICFMSYCNFWGVQVCASDGASFGPCHEDPVPSECRAVARDDQYSRTLEQCCLDNGFCCVDAFDLDGDGNKSEMLGDCQNVVCQ